MHMDRNLAHLWVVSARPNGELLNKATTNTFRKQQVDKHIVEIQPPLWAVEIHAGEGLPQSGYGNICLNNNIFVGNLFAETLSHKLKEIFMF